jgi:hypothetical protein
MPLGLDVSKGGFCGFRKAWVFGYSAELLASLEAYFTSWISSLRNAFGHSDIFSEL